MRAAIMRPSIYPKEGIKAMGRPKKVVETTQETEVTTEPTTFAEMPSSPVIEHKKTLAKKSSAKKIEKNDWFYTQDKDKVLKIIVKKKGQYSVYIGSAKKHADVLNDQIKKWIKEERWVPYYQVEEKVQQIMATL